MKAKIKIVPKDKMRSKEFFFCFRDQIIFVRKPSVKMVKNIYLLIML